MTDPRRPGTEWQVVEADAGPMHQEIMSELRERWERETNGNAVFISATEKRNIDTLRQTVLEKVREMYRARYPYKTEYNY